MEKRIENLELLVKDLIDILIDEPEDSNYQLKATLRKFDRRDDLRLIYERLEVSECDY